MSSTRRLTLASASPRRQALLQAAGLEFDVEIRPIPETWPSHLPATQVAQYLAEKKASAWQSNELASKLLLTADTTVVLADQVLNKPADLQEAAAMLQSLSGSWHEVITGVCLRTETTQDSFSDIARVEFRPLSDAQIDHYLATQPPLDKAGAYGIQDWIGMIGIHRIEGDYYSIMGLPIGRVYQKVMELV